MTRDEALKRAIRYAKDHFKVYMVGEHNGQWLMWASDEEFPRDMIVESIRYILPYGEITKLS